MQTWRVLSLIALAGLAACAGPARDTAVLRGPHGQATTLHRQRTPIHTESDGIALSPDGRLALLAAMGRPADELLLIALAERTATRITLARPGGRILDPAFSPDGRWFVAVVDPDPAKAFDQGPTHLVIAEPAGAGEPTVLLDDGQRRRHPTVSPDGRRIAYFRSLDLPARSAAAYALFEYDLATRTERRLARQAFGNPGPIFHHPADAGLFYSAVDPLDPAPGGEDRWVSGAGLADWAEIGYAGDFWLARGAEIPRRPQPVAPATGATRAAHVIGVTTAGDPILMTPAAVGVFRGGAFAQAFPLDPKISLCSGWAPDASGAAYVANANCAAGDPMHLRLVPSTLFVWRGGVSTAIPFGRLALAAAPRMLP